MHTLISFLIGTTYALAGVIIACLTFRLLTALGRHTADRTTGQLIIDTAWVCLSALIT